MRDASDSKATKSSTGFSPPQTVHSKAESPRQDKSGAKKGGKESNQRRKKSNTSSTSRGKNSSNQSDDQQTTILVKEFVEQLIDKACNIATAAGDVSTIVAPSKKIPASLDKELEESKSKAPRSSKNLTSMVVVEDLGMILARQE